MKETFGPGDFPVLTDGEVSLRLISTAGDRDFERIGVWLSDPRVLAFYGGVEEEVDASQARLEYHPDALFPEEVRPCIIEWRGTPVGYLQFYPLQDGSEYQLKESPGEGSWAMDLYLGVPEIWGRGIGSRSIRLILEYLFESLEAERVFIDPHAENERAIKAYEKCGFEVVQFLKNHEIQDGTWRDAWLMEVTKSHWLQQ